MDHNFASVLDQLTQAVTVRLIATRSESLVCASSAWTQLDVLKESEQRGHEFDVLPVRDNTADPIRRYWQLHRGAGNSVDGATLRDVGLADLIDAHAAIPTLISLFIRNPRRFFFVLQEGNVSGLIDWSDLNRPAACTALFPVVQRVEESIRSMIWCHLGGNRWLDYVRDDRRRKIESVAEKRRKANINTDTLSAALFSDLTHICASYGVVHSVLGPDQSRIVTERDLLNDLRERVCHGTESLVDDSFDVSRLHEALRVADRWTDRLMSIGGRKADGPQSG